MTRNESQPPFWLHASSDISIDISGIRFLFLDAPASVELTFARRVGLSAHDWFASWASWLRHCAPRVRGNHFAVTLWLLIYIHTQANGR